MNGPLLARILELIQVLQLETEALPRTQGGFVGVGAVKCVAVNKRSPPNEAVERNGRSDLWR